MRAKLTSRIDWRRRAATISGGVALGLAALAFAWMSDAAFDAFLRLGAPHSAYMLALTPLVLMAVVYVTIGWFSGARGSGIPQVIALARQPDRVEASGFLTLPVAAAKALLTAAVLLVGGAVGREGPTVQLAAAINVAVHRRFGANFSAGVLLAGGAAGVAAAFNTPLAGVAFAIEELAAAYEQRVAALVMMTVMIAGFVSLGTAGDYVYLGAVRGSLPLQTALTAIPLAGMAARRPAA